MQPTPSATSATGHAFKGAEVVGVFIVCQAGRGVVWVAPVRPKAQEDKKPVPHHCTALNPVQMILNGRRLLSRCMKLGGGVESTTRMRDRSTPKNADNATRSSRPTGKTCLLRGSFGHSRTIWPSSCALISKVPIRFTRSMPKFYTQFKRGKVPKVLPLFDCRFQITEKP